MTPLDLHFVKGRIKIEIGLARGKKQYDKRETEKLRDWNREKQRLLRNRSGSGKTGALGLTSMSSGRVSVRPAVAGRPGADRRDLRAPCRNRHGVVRARRAGR